MRVSKAMQSKVDEYIELDAKMKELQAQLKALRKEIEPFMADNHIPVIKGTYRGSISLKPRDMAVVSSKYTTYDVDGVVPLLDPKVRRECLTRVIDRDVLELMVKAGKAPQSVYNHKIVNPVVAFMIDHK